MTGLLPWEISVFVKTLRNSPAHGSCQPESGAEGNGGKGTAVRVGICSLNILEKEIGSSGGNTKHKQNTGQEAAHVIGSTISFHCSDSRSGIMLSPGTAHRWC